MQPNVKSGIFRNLNNNTKNVCPKYKESNVFISPAEPKGRIINIKEFHDLYVRDVSDKIVQSNSEYCDSKQPHIGVLKSMEGYKKLSQSKRLSEIEPVGLLQESLSIFDPNTISCGRIICDTAPLPAVESQKKVIYRIIHPDELSLHSKGMETGEISKSFTVVPLHEEESNFTVKPDNPSKTLLKKPPGQRGRPRKSQRKKISATSKEQAVPKITQITARTRSGRLSKLPKHIQNNFQSDIKVYQASIFEKNPDTDYKCNIKTKTTEISREPNNSINMLLSTDDQKSKRERNIPPEYVCSVCHKIYLGKSRMLQHMEAHPEHFINSNLNQALKEMSLYQFLVKKIKSNTDNEEQRVEIFLNELTDLFDQLHSRNTCLVRNSSSVHFINSRAARVLGVPEGHFEIDINAIDTIPNITKPDQRLFAPPPRLDYNLSISLDDTIADAKLNLSDNMITSDDSLLRMTVDDLVKERIKHLNTDEDIISRVHYDHSDNAVEAVSMKETQAPPILDLSLDLFQFSSN